jgi:hypothetical protein
MEDDCMKALVSVVGQRLRREFAVESPSLPPGMMEQLDRLQWIADPERLDQGTPGAFGVPTRPKGL